MAEYTDSRLLSNVQNLTGCLTRIAALREIVANYTATPTAQVWGYLVQEFKLIYPQFSRFNANPPDDGVGALPAGYDYWSLLLEPLIPDITGAIGEMLALFSPGGSRIYPTAPNPLADVTLGASGVAKTVAQITLTQGRWAAFCKMACNTQSLTVSIANMDLSISDTANTHNTPNLVRDFGSLLGTSRNISAQPLFVDVASGTKVIYAVMSATGVWTGNAPITSAASSEFFAVKTGSL